MAIRLIKFCDGHLESTQEEVIGETIPPVTMPSGKRKVLDLCEPCRKEIPYQLLIDLLEEYGREADHEKQRMSRATVKKEVPDDKKSQCRFCERNDFTQQGRKMHERRSHLQELADLEAKEAAEARGDIVVPDSELPANYCRVCESQLSSSQAFQGHLASKKHAKRLQEVMA